MKIAGNNGVMEVAPVIEEIPISIQIENLKQQLFDTDYIAVKIAEGSATPEEYADKIAQRQSWRAEINSLEALLND